MKRVILKPHEQQNAHPWDTPPFDEEPVLPPVESRWETGTYPREEEEHEEVARMAPRYVWKLRWVRRSFGLHL